MMHIRMKIFHNIARSISLMLVLLKNSTPYQSGDCPPPLSPFTHTHTV